MIDSGKNHTIKNDGFRSNQPPVREGRWLCDEENQAPHRPFCNPGIFLKQGISTWIMGTTNEREWTPIQWFAGDQPVPTQLGKLFLNRRSAHPMPSFV